MLGDAPEILKDVVEATQMKAQKYLQQLKYERTALGRDNARWSNEVFKTTSKLGQNETDTPGVARLADLEERVQQNECRMVTVDKELAEIDFLKSRLDPGKKPL